MLGVTGGYAKPIIEYGSIGDMNIISSHDDYGD